MVSKYPDYKEKFLYLTNGLDIDGFYNQIPLLDYDKKENLIITVGRIGAKEKNNSMLLNAISKIDLNDWKVLFIGPIEESFKNDIDNFYKINPSLINKVIFTGAIYDRKILLEFYAKSKIFCLTSIEESFGFVLIEAMSYGNYIVTTDVSSAREITEDEKYGRIVEDDIGLANTLNDLILNSDKYDKLSIDIANYTNKKYNWKQVVTLLETHINTNE